MNGGKIGFQSTRKRSVKRMATTLSIPLDIPDIEVLDIKLNKRGDSVDPNFKLPAVQPSLQ
jgi:hypothetical protein